MEYTIEYQIKTIGSWEKIVIVKVSYGFSQIIKNGEWVNTSPEPRRIEENVLEFSNCFLDSKSAQKFIKSKLFKSVFNSVVKNTK